MENVWRPDEIQPQEANREELLALTKEVRDYQIKVPKVL
jgi:Asp-tRNA(Asn)/Glu-tRNA(Gln) amidotransferase C subunit